MKIAIVGAGAMAGALAIHFERSAHSVAICATRFDGAILEAVRKDRMHPTLHYSIPESVDMYDHRHWSRGFRRAEIVALAVPSVGVLSTVTAAQEHLGRNAIWAVATKGWVAGSGRPMSEFIEEVSPHHPVVMVVGPSLAAEIAAGTPTALVCASRNMAAAHTVAAAITSPILRGFVTDDVPGVEVGSALKNVLAIAIGMCDGIAELKGRSMTNAKGALYSRGLVEMGRLAAAMGGRPETVLGPSGAGDLFLTVLGGRNGRFGRLVGDGAGPDPGVRADGYHGRGLRQHPGSGPACQTYRRIAAGGRDDSQRPLPG